MATLVTGATGFVGRRLLPLLNKPRVLSRNKDAAKAKLGVEAFNWAGTGQVPTDAFEGVDTVIHLAGEPVADGRWSAARKEAIHKSRKEGTQALVESMLALEKRPKVLISASAVGIYGDRGDELLDESSSAGPDSEFLTKVCLDWEAATRPAVEAGLRVVNLRIGIVLGDGGGALEKMLLPFKLGVGGPLGNGKHWMPWIHIDDLVGLIVHAAKNDSLKGPVNGTAPEPVTNAVFTKALSRALGKPSFMNIFPAPYFGLRLAFGEFAKILFESQRVAPKAALASGYEFRHREIDSALTSIFNSP